MRASSLSPQSSRKMSLRLEWRSGWLYLRGASPGGGEGEEKQKCDKGRCTTMPGESWLCWLVLYTESQRCSWLFSRFIWGCGTFLGRAAPRSCTSGRSIDGRKERKFTCPAPFPLPFPIQVYPWRADGLPCTARLCPRHPGGLPSRSGSEKSDCVHMSSVCVCGGGQWGGAGGRPWSPKTSPWVAPQRPSLPPIEMRPWPKLHEGQS